MNRKSVRATMRQITIQELAGHWGDANQPNRDLLKRADIIRGVDPVHGNEALFFGKDLLEAIACGRGGEFDDKLIVEVTLDFSKHAEQLEFLCATVEHLKGPGTCCYGK